MDLLTNPWVIIIIVLSVIIGNIMALKYTAKMKFGQKDKIRSANQENKTHSDSDETSVSNSVTENKDATLNQIDKKDPQK